MKISKKVHEEIWFSPRRYEKRFPEKSEFIYINKDGNHILNRRIGPSIIADANEYNIGSIIYQWLKGYYEVRKNGPSYIRTNGGAKFFTFNKNIDCIEEEYWNA